MRRGIVFEEVLIATAVAGIICCLLGGVYYRLTHRCVRSHTEQRMSCTSYHPGNSGGFGFTDCSPYTAEVCDKWEEKR